MNFTLSNGIQLPAVGFGTYKSTDSNGKEILTAALKTGYRYFDTASFYQNEEIIGSVLKESDISRKDIFLATKVWKADMGYNSTLRAFSQSLEKLQTDYIDLYLIHWPKADLDAPNWAETLQDTWKAMETLYNGGKVRVIGVCNCLPHHIEAIKATGTILPMVNQLELHAGYMQEAASAYCRAHEIQLQAWSPLGRTRIMEDAVIKKMAEKYQVSPAKFLLRFLIDCGIAVIPKASSNERMLQNLQLDDFSISQEDCLFIRCLPQKGWSGEHPDLVRVPI